MKIAVVGIGVAGAYLMNRLSDDHDNHVVGFERTSRDQHDAVCAWATCENVMGDLAKNCGLNFDDYILHDGKHMCVDLKENGGSIDIKLKGMVSYDKLALIQDMITGTDIRYGRAPRKDELESDFDIILDSTGFHRNYLPRVRNEMYIPCVQYKVRYNPGKEPYDDFYLRAFPLMSGYFWYFPLSNGYAHIGAGDFLKNHNRLVNEFINKSDCEVIKKVGRPIRLTPPEKCEPFTDGRKSVGVGESIGTVYPLLGEGIIPSTWCAELLVQNLHDMQAYRESVLEKFKIYSLVFKFIQLKINGNFSIIKHGADMLKLYLHMKSEEERYGMKVRMADMLELSRI
ncbi:MAG: NAD(P)/FAD-dependent oxidoreductase [Thermoproteota archaeon]|jgi:flavin-dependent dehydrogenase|nr:NAD(P)/FAD-dependent oxidoreductase [Thermoproteota archaeon]